jgi:hypothetical protein
VPNRAAATGGDPTLAAVASILTPINEQLQKFKNWVDNARNLATAAADGQQ